jgi:hypothetical protein
LLSNKLEILMVLMAIVTGASLVLKTVSPLTKSLKDDKWLARLEKLLGVLEKLALNVRR